jgi:hypothetical protein
LPVLYLKNRERERVNSKVKSFSSKTHLSSNFCLTSALALRLRAGSLNISLLTLFLSKLISTEYLEEEEEVKFRN